MFTDYPNFHVVPLKVILGEREWREPDLSNAQLFYLVAEGSLHPRTSQPSPGEFIKVFEPIMQEDHDIIVITISGGLSGTVGSAGTAARMTGFPGIYIVDSGTTAIGMVKLAQAAFALEKQGMTAKEIAERLTAMSAATYTMFITDTLEYLHKGGRIGGAAALFGAILQIKPILYLAEGKISVLDKVRTRSRALARMTDELSRHRSLAYIGVVHIEAKQDAERFAGEIRERFPSTPVSVSSTGSVLGAHLGPGVIGLIFQESLSEEEGTDGVR
jgi:DegV family protein with EDD domain